MKYYYFGSQRVAMRGGNEVYYLHGDHLGSTSLTTNVTGTVVAETRHHPFGEVRWQSNEGVTDFGFTGQRNEVGFGLMDYNARFYSPGLGRFVSADSLIPDSTNPQMFNRYSYVSNNPIIYVDPSGQVQNAAGDVGGLYPDVEMEWEPPAGATLVEIQDAHHQRIFDLLAHYGGRRALYPNTWTAKDEEIYQSLLMQADAIRMQNMVGEEEWWDYALEQFGSDMYLGGVFVTIGMTNQFGAGLADDFFIDADSLFPTKKGSSRGGSSGGSSHIVTPEGRGNTGRNIPNNLEEQLAMEEVMSDPKGITIPVSMSDPRWPASEGWVKIAQHVNGVEIHYLHNTKTNQFDDFKFK